MCVRGEEQWGRDLPPLNQAFFQTRKSAARREWKYIVTINERSPLRKSKGGPATLEDVLYYRLAVFDMQCRFPGLKHMKSNCLYSTFKNTVWNNLNHFSSKAW